MGEKAYNTMRWSGIWNLVVGILAIVAGLIVGTISIISAAKLMKNKSEITF